MKTDQLYPLTKRDFPRAIKILCHCFVNDPLYQKLIPQEHIRLQALPELFTCDLHEMFSNCDVYSDSPEVNGLLIADDETEDYNPFQFYSTEAFYALKTDAYLIKEDFSLKTLRNFFVGRNYLNSQWLEELDTDRRIHIIYLAVAPEKQGTGIAHRLLLPVLEYADQNGLLVTLETHNPRNVAFYRNYGFETFEKELQGSFDLIQYCLIRKPGQPIPPWPLPKHGSECCGGRDCCSSPPDHIK
ncbi:MAG: N-acetyltransferase [Oscillospiraceae bacterium]